MTNEHGILFSAPMVQAILDGSKTMTRRIVKPQPPSDWSDSPGAVRVEQIGGEWEYLYNHVSTDEILHIAYWPIGFGPYGAPGGLLNVREAWATYRAFDSLKPSELKPSCSIHYLADTDKPAWPIGKTRASIHMPRWASRLTLRLTGVRVERLQAITEADAQAEGVESVDKYRELWNALNARHGYPWESNPWVWCLTFKRVEV